ncbi:MAG: thiamine-phosphate kinase, partial [Actinomycetota bacterium]
AAMLQSGGRYLVSTDTLIENHDFKTSWSTGFDIGFKSAASNLADIAAMGAIPSGMVVALVVPKTTEISWLEEFAKGLQSAIDSLAPEASVVGGDLAAGSEIVVSVTVFGELDGTEAVLRSGAKVGDVLAVSGSLGRAACGLALLQSGNSDFIRSYDDWVVSHLRPTPNLEAGVLAAKAGATAMLDVSDSLLLDSERIAKASSVAIDIHSLQLKGFEATLDLPAQALGVNPAIWVLEGGEDHALLATFPKGSKIPRSFKPIGEVVSGEGKLLLDGEPIQATGWDSIRGEIN